MESSQESATTPSEPSQELTEPTTTTVAAGPDNDSQDQETPVVAGPPAGPPNQSDNNPPMAPANSGSVNEVLQGIDFGVTTATQLHPPPAPAEPVDPAAPPPLTVVPDVGADLPTYILTEADKLLDSIYGDHVHDNDGTHLDGGIATDRLWQRRWTRMRQLSTTRYIVPKGAVGRRFLTILVDEFRGVRDRQWNSERPLIFATVVLQKTPGVRRAKDIRLRMTKRMDRWDQGCHTALVDDTELEVLQKVSASRAPDDETRARSFNARVLSGRLNSAVRTLTNRSGGGVLQPDDLCSKAGRPVLDVLQEKHPELREPPSVGTIDGAFEPYPDRPTPIPVDVTAEDVESVSSRLSGAAGPGGTDAVDLRNWLLRFGKESEALRLEMAAWTNWLANTHPPWAAYRAIMSNRLVALDKMPGTRPVGIGEVYRRLWAKCLLKVIGHHATTACGNFNLCAGLPAGIEGAVHAIQSVFADCSIIEVPATEADPTPAAMTQEPTTDNLPATPPSPITATDDTPLADQDMGEFLGNLGTALGLTTPEYEACLLVDARNGFNELGRKAMLWTVRHQWAGGSRFAFNC